MRTIANQLINDPHISFILHGDEDNGFVIKCVNGCLLNVKFSDLTTTSTALCNVCNLVKPGWPNAWRNISKTGTQYACLDCHGQKT